MELRVKEIIKSRGLTMQDIADKLEITRDTLTRNINGNPTIGTLSKIAEVLEVNLTDLFVNNTTDELTALIQHRGDFYKANTLQELEDIVKKIKNQEK